MCESKQNNAPEYLTETVLRTANVSPETRLATDFLNPFNEYLMLAEMVETKSMPPEVLSEWRPIDYETHFAQSGFASAAVTIAAYRSLATKEKQCFNLAVGELIDLIVTHQKNESHTNCPSLVLIAAQRDIVAGIISGEGAVTQEDANSQAAIDALFD